MRANNWRELLVKYMAYMVDKYDTAQVDILNDGGGLLDFYTEEVHLYQVIEEEAEKLLIEARLKKEYDDEQKATA